jgi:starvation-inducible DNA-binding protein
LQRIKDSDAEHVDSREMLAELREDNRSLSARLREIHGVCDEYRDSKPPRAVLIPPAW